MVKLGGLSDLHAGGRNAVNVGGEGNVWNAYDVLRIFSGSRGVAAVDGPADQCMRCTRGREFTRCLSDGDRQAVRQAFHGGIARYGT